MAGNGAGGRPIIPRSVRAYRREALLLRRLCTAILIDKSIDGDAARETAKAAEALAVKLDSLADYKATGERAPIT
jgi:phosphatidylserine synthase